MTQETKIWDPLRGKAVALTPEENVRQWFIGVLKETCGVPEHMMRSEVAMQYGEAGKLFRADIVVYDRAARPLLLVECKRPEVQIGPEVLRQALRYDMVQKVRYIAVTNGKQTFFFELASEGWRPLGAIPKYEDMI